MQKTQTSFSNRHLFACVSFGRVKRKAELAQGYLVLTLELPYALESARVAAKTEPYPGRWTAHIVLNSPEDLDAELLEWLSRSMPLRRENKPARRFRRKRRAPNPV